jgi:hypothetical protein
LIHHIKAQKMDARTEKERVQIKKAVGFEAPLSAIQTTGQTKYYCKAGRYSTILISSKIEHLYDQEQQ